MPRHSRRNGGRRRSPGRPPRRAGRYSRSSRGARSAAARHHRHRMHLAERMAFRISAALEQQQFLEAFEEIVALARILAGAQRIGRDLIGARRAAETEIDAARKQRLQHLESLGDHQRRVVWQHHAARADAHMRRRRRDLADHDFGRGAGDVRKIVVFRDPVALVAEPVGKPRQIERIAQRRRARRSGGDGRQIEDGKWDHAGNRFEPVLRLPRSQRSSAATSVSPAALGGWAGCLIPAAPLSRAMALRHHAAPDAFCGPVACRLAAAIDNSARLRKIQVAIGWLAGAGGDLADAGCSGAAAAGLPCAQRFGGLRLWRRPLAMGWASGARRVDAVPGGVGGGLGFCRLRAALSDIPVAGVRRRSCCAETARPVYPGQF